MTEQRTIAFSKMSGLGNDFIIIDARKNALALTPEQVRQLATRDNQITKGCDQVLVLHPPKSGGDIFMQIFNADGGQVEACGNGTRAVAQWLAKKGEGEEYGSDILIHIETLGGLLRCQFIEEYTEETKYYAKIIMPPPKFGWRDIPLNKEINDTAQVQLHEDLPPAFLVNVGNPHAVFFVADSDNVDDMAQKYGEELVHHSLFKQGANINFAHIRKDRAREIDIATWERGAGLTQACGTGACAVVIATKHRSLVDINALTSVSVFPPFARQNNDGGDYIIVSYDYEPENGTLLQHGPATLEFDGEITL